LSFSQALEFVPADAAFSLVEFTDRSLIGDDINPLSLEKLIRATARPPSCAPGFAWARTSDIGWHGVWDTADLLWEVRIFVKKHASGFRFEVMDSHVIGRN